MFSNDDSDNLMTAPTQRTLSDYIADRLRSAILSNQFKPNQRLVEQEIAESMQTSRGPVRDALKILENEGLVNRQSHRGAFVAELTRKDADEIYTIREALETLAVKFAIQNATTRQIDELEKLVHSIENLARDHSDDQWGATDLDLEFHHTLCKISGHHRLLIAWEALSGQIRLLLLQHRLRDPADLRIRAASWHQRVVEAIYQRNTELALQELHKHLAISYEGIIKSIEEKETVLSPQA